MSKNHQRPPNYLKYFQAFLVDQPICDLPRELRVCEDCGLLHTSYQMLVAGSKGRRRGIQAIAIIRCDGCLALHLTQLFTPDAHGKPVQVGILTAIARDIGHKVGPVRRGEGRPQPDA